MKVKGMNGVSGPHLWKNGMGLHGAPRLIQLYPPYGQKKKERTI